MIDLAKLNFFTYWNKQGLIPKHLPKQSAESVWFAAHRTLALKKWWSVPTRPEWPEGPVARVILLQCQPVQGPSHGAVWSAAGRPWSASQQDTAKADRGMTARSGDARLTGTEKNGRGVWVVWRGKAGKFCSSTLVIAFTLFDTHFISSVFDTNF